MRWSAGAGLAVPASATLGAPTLRQASAQAGDTALVCNADGVRVREEPGLFGTVIGSVSGGLLST